MRALTLHVSALNDLEYNSYTDALNDLTSDGGSPKALISDDYYNKVSVGVREVRAWLRGRYATLPVGDIDAILKFFYPNLSQKDMLNAGQFFAVMRLVMHAMEGKGVDKSLAFVQAHPESVALTIQSTVQDPHPRRFSQPAASIPSMEPSADKNPFHFISIASSSKPHPPKPPIHPDINVPTSSIIAPAPVSKSTNPFLNGSKAGDFRSNGGNDVTMQKLPPLPPRKPTSLLAASQLPIPPPPRSLILPPSAPLVRNLKTTHVLSPLMRQSLEASRVAHSLRKAEESLERERVLQVLKSSSGNGSSTSSLRNTSSSPTKRGTSTTSASTSSSENRRVNGYGSPTPLPVLPPRRSWRSGLHRPPSVADSTMSYEQVAKANVAFRSAPSSAPSSEFFSRSPERGRSLPSLDNDEPRASSFSPTRRSNITPPPRHPDRKPQPVLDKEHQVPSSPSSQYSISSSTRISRSKSMNHTSTRPPPLPPMPPSRNARNLPESLQMSPTSTVSSSPIPPGTPGVSRRSSLTSPHNRASSIDSQPSMKRHIKKTISSLQPKFDAARYKAEAGLTRRGYVNHSTTSPIPGAFKNWAEEGEEKLIDIDGGEDGVTVDVDDNSLSYDEDSETPSSARGYGRVHHKWNSLEKDELKLPTGNGWKPLS